ncbi:protein LSM14 homolog A-like [Asterias rubens]|uniref:protein LSM14 homolog A-like n=1 Tax=Asterias rubens TaxID=7604 RepID=UPI001455A0C6|nr:protein LSM14 homolog A-like [Asterias rubens]
MTDGGPYIGSTISLISQSEIRYEGCLYSIDTVKSTVTLSQVRSFGTEGREAPRTVVAGDEVYSLIIFKGSDIKELHVCEPPKPQSNIAQDPAILQHSAAIPSSHSTAPGYHRGPSFNNAQGQYSSYNRMPYNQYGHIGGVMPGFFGGQPSHPPGLSGHTTPPPTMTRRSPTMEQGVQASGPISPQKDTKASTKVSAADKHQSKDREEQGLPQRSQQQRRRGSKEEKPNQKKEIHRQEGKDKKPENKVERPERGERIERGERGERGERTDNRGERGDRDNRGRSSQGQRQNWQGYNQNRRGRGRGPRSPGVKEKVGSDFDFSNAQFEKKTLEEEFTEKLKLDGSSTVNGDVVKGTEDSGNETQPSDAPEEEEPYYDSSKSFFDNISSDLKGQRQNWKEERKMNCETFGIAYARNRGRGGYYRGYYRGGYRGNYQGGRGQSRGGRSYRSNRGRGGWRNQGGWNDHANDTNQQSEITVKTEQATEATS